MRSWFGRHCLQQRRGKLGFLTLEDVRATLSKHTLRHLEELPLLDLLVVEQLRQLCGGEARQGHSYKLWLAWPCQLKAAQKTI